MEELSSLSSVSEDRYVGYVVYDDAGEKVGKVENLIVGESDHMEYIGIKMRSFEQRATLIPMQLVRVNEQRQLIEVSAFRESIEEAPALDNEITPEFEQQIQSFFGLISNGALELPSADWVVPFLLVCLRERDYYGHELVRRMIDLGFRATPPEAMYRALQQIEKEGMVISKAFGVDCRLSRHRYSITEFGEAYLEYLANALGQYREEIDLFFRLYNEYPCLGAAGEDQSLG